MMEYYGEIMGYYGKMMVLLRGNDVNVELELHCGLQYGAGSVAVHYNYEEMMGQLWRK